jgi:hypothetical protein
MYKSAKLLVDKAIQTHMEMFGEGTLTLWK